MEARIVGEDRRLLERMLALDNLRWAWRRVADNQGAAGGDGVTLSRFAHRLEANLLALADDVRGGRYRPGIARQVTVHEAGKRRVLTVQPVRDRVLQRAALDILVPRAERMFMPDSYGYRPGRSVQDAVERIVRLRERGLGWVVDADIRDCFGSLDHQLLLAYTDDLVADAGVRRLIRQWIAPRGTRPGGPSQLARAHRPNVGIALGAVISPLFCNLYLHRLDTGLHRRRLQSVRYADDFVILCRSREQAEWALRGAEKVLRGLKLELQPSKTRVTSFDDGFTFLGVTFLGDSYHYVTEGKRVVVRGLPPPDFHYHAEGYVW